MRKFIYIPIVILGKQPKGVFLEIMSEPTFLGGVNFQALRQSGVKSAVANAEKILAKLAYSALSASELYLGNHFLNLNQLTGISLGLLLAAFIQQASCPYQKIIALGEIKSDCPQLSISGGYSIKTQIPAILALDKQTYPLPLFLPKVLVNEINQNTLAQLTDLNIILKPVATLYDALADFGINLNKKA